MKKSVLLFTMMFAVALLSAQELKMNFSQATGSGWSVLSSSPETITLKEKTQTYLLSTESFNVADFKGFKLTFAQKPENVHFFIRGLNSAGEDKMDFVQMNLDGLTMSYNITNLVDVVKMGIRFGSNSSVEQTTIKIESFYLVDKNGALKASVLPSASDAQKLQGYWSREFGQSAQIIYTGNYNRELVWEPKDINDYNMLKVEFSEPLAQDYEVRIKMDVGKKEQTGYKSISKGATSMTVNLKKDYKDSGAQINRVIFVGKAKGDVVDFKSVVLTK